MELAAAERDGKVEASAVVDKERSVPGIHFVAGVCLLLLPLTPERDAGG